MDAVWIMEKDVLEAESKGFVIVAPDSCYDHTPQSNIV